MRVFVYGKETDDGTWKAELWEERDTDRWIIQQFKAWGKEGEVKWEPMGYEKIFHDKKTAELTLSRLGYLPID